MEEQTANRGIHDAVQDALSSIESPGTFAAVVALPFREDADPLLSVLGVGDIKLPLSPADAKKLINQSRLAPFGDGEKTVVDTNVRNTWEIDSENISFQNKKWTDSITSAVQHLGQKLGLHANEDISCMPHKLLIYEKGAKFALHRDSEKAPNHFATMVLQLPSKHTGGSVYVKHGGETKVFNTSKYSNRFQFLAWYTDAIHEVKEITSGVRLVLTYNLCLTNTDAPRPTIGSMTTKQKLRNAFKAWQGESNEPKKPYILAHILDHKYSRAAFCYQLLKGQDLARTTTLKDIAEEYGFRVYLAQMEKHILSNVHISDWECMKHEQNGTCPEIEPGIIAENRLSLENLTELDGTPYINHMPIEESEIVQKDPFEKDPDEKEFSGLTGNEGTTVDHWYQDSIVLLVPPCNVPVLQIRSWTCIWTGFDSEKIEKYLKDQAEAVRKSEDATIKAELQQHCKLLLEHHGSPWTTRSNDKRCRTMPTLYEETLHSMAATALELDMMSVFKEAAQAFANESATSYRSGIPKLTKMLVSLMHQSKDLELVDWWVSIQPRLQVRIETIDTVIAAYEEFLRDASVNVNMEQIDDPDPLNLSKWRKARRVQAVLECLESQRMAEIPLVLQIGQEANDENILQQADNLISKERDFLKTSFAPLQPLREIVEMRDILGDEMVQRYGEKILEVAAQADKLQYFMACDVPGYMTLAEEAGGKIPRLMVPILKNGIKNHNCQIEYLKFIAGSTSSCWKDDALGKLYCKEVLDPSIDHLELQGMGITRGLASGRNYMSEEHILYMLDLLRMVGFTQSRDMLFEKLARFMEMESTLFSPRIWKEVGKWSRARARAKARARQGGTIS